MVLYSFWLLKVLLTARRHFWLVVVIMVFFSTAFCKNDLCFSCPYSGLFSKGPTWIRKRCSPSRLHRNKSHMLYVKKLIGLFVRKASSNGCICLGVEPRQDWSACSLLCFPIQPYGRSSSSWGMWLLFWSAWNHENWGWSAPLTPIHCSSESLHAHSD